LFQKVNEITIWLDLSSIYASSNSRAGFLRSNLGGSLKTFGGSKNLLMKSSDMLQLIVEERRLKEQQQQQRRPHNHHKHHSGQLKAKNRQPLNSKCSPL